MTHRIHRVTSHPQVLHGVEAVSLLTDHAFPRHAHDQFGIGVMVSGAQRSWSGIGAVEAEAGDVITVNPGEMHDGRPVGGLARGWHMLYFDQGFVSRETEREGMAGTEITRPALRDPHVFQHVGRAFARLTDAVPDRLAIEQDLLRCLAYAFGRYGTRRPATQSLSPSVARARQCLDEAPERRVTLAELAALEGVSRFQLLRGFARETGATPHAYLVQRRVGVARRLLALGEPIAEVALRAGFADQSHMSRAFRRQFGTTPARYRTTLLRT